MRCCEIRDVLAKAIGTGRQHKSHDDNRKDLLIGALNLHVEAQSLELKTHARRQNSTVVPAEPRLRLDSGPQSYSHESRRGHEEHDTWHLDLQCPAWSWGIFGHSKLLEVAWGWVVWSCKSD